MSKCCWKTTGIQLNKVRRQKMTLLKAIPLFDSTSYFHFCLTTRHTFSYPASILIPLRFIEVFRTFPLATGRNGNDLVMMSRQTNRDEQVSLRWRISWMIHIWTYKKCHDFMTPTTVSFVWLMIWLKRSFTNWVSDRQWMRHSSQIMLFMSFTFLVTASSLFLFLAAG